jgi:hypothetical protein
MLSGTLKKSGVARTPSSAGLSADSNPVDGATILLHRTGFAGLFSSTQRLTTDGNGRFGASNLKPGRYRVQSPDRTKSQTVTIAPGRVTGAALTE